MICHNKIIFIIILLILLFILVNYYNNIFERFNVDEYMDNYSLIYYDNRYPRHPYRPYFPYNPYYNPNDGSDPYARWRSFPWWLSTRELNKYPTDFYYPAIQDYYNRSYNMYNMV